MSDFNRFEIAIAAREAGALRDQPRAPTAPRRELSPAARLIAAQPLQPAYSPIVVAGIVRAVEFGVILAVGCFIYFGYVFPIYGFDWYYPASVATIAALAVLGFQAAEVYDVHAFRNPFGECARMAIAWSVIFLIGSAVAFFAHLGDFYSRIWFAAFFGIGILTLVC
jgi:hypothetical protein